MQDIIQKMTSEHIVGESAVKSFIYECIYSLKLGAGFNPDTDFRDYIDSNETPCFTDAEAEELNNSLSECFDECEKLGIDIYEIAINIVIPFSSSYTEYYPERMESEGIETSGDIDKTSIFLVCDITGMWIERKQDGTYFTIMESESIVGTWDECVKFLQDRGPN